MSAGLLRTWFKDRSNVVRWEIEIDGVDSKDAAINAFNTLYDILPPRGG